MQWPKRESTVALLIIVAAVMVLVAAIVGSRYQRREPSCFADASKVAAQPGAKCSVAF